MTPKVGQVIRLEDARGCWCLHTVSRHDQWSGGTFELAGQVWRGLHFYLDFEASPKTNGIAHYRALRPAIGGAEAPYSPLFLPAGWHAPALARPA